MFPALAAEGQAREDEGWVRITAPEMTAAHVLPSAVIGLRREHPGLRIEVVASNTVRDLRRGEANVAACNGEPTDPELVAQHMPDGAGGLFATPNLLARRREPVRLEDLDCAPFLRLAAHRELRTSARIRVVFNRLAEVLGDGHVDTSGNLARRART